MKRKENKSLHNKTRSSSRRRQCPPCDSIRLSIKPEFQHVVAATYGNRFLMNNQCHKMSPKYAGLQNRQCLGQVYKQTPREAYPSVRCRNIGVPMLWRCVWNSYEGQVMNPVNILWRSFTVLQKRRKTSGQTDCLRGDNNTDNKLKCWFILLGRPRKAKGLRSSCQQMHAWIFASS